MPTPKQPDQRTHELLRQLGIRCGKVERFIGNQRSDLIGFIDQIAMNPRALAPLPGGIIAIQSTGGDSNGNGNARVAKIRSEANWTAAADWLQSGGHLYVFSWVRKAVGARTLHEPRYYRIVDQKGEVEWRKLG